MIADKVPQVMSLESAPVSVKYEERIKKTISLVQRFHSAMIIQWRTLIIILSDS